MTIVISIEGQFRTATVGQETVRTVCTAGTVAVAVAVAAVVTVAVAVAVAAAVAGGKSPSAPATTSARAPGPAPSSTSCGTHPPLPTHSPKDPISPTTWPCTAMDRTLSRAQVAAPSRPRGICFTKLRKHGRGGIATWRVTPSSARGELCSAGGRHSVSCPTRCARQTQGFSNLRPR